MTIRCRLLGGTAKNLSSASCSIWRWRSEDRRARPSRSAGWTLPQGFGTLRRPLDVRIGKPGEREFVQILCLVEAFFPNDLLAEVTEAISREVIGFDAVKHLMLCRIERCPPRLHLEVYLYLRRPR